MSPSTILGPTSLAADGCKAQHDDVAGFAGIKKAHILGRVYTITPRQGECFYNYLRLLLHHIRGPESLLYVGLDISRMTTSITWPCGRQQLTTAAPLTETTQTINTALVVWLPGEPIQYRSCTGFCT